jgi:hypothetical protein
MWRGNKLQGLVWFSEGDDVKFKVGRERNKRKNNYCLQSPCMLGAYASQLS